MREYVSLSLETHLFFGRIMKEHSLFLLAGFPAKETEFIKRVGIIRVHGKYKKHLKPLCQGKGRIHPLPACPSKEDVIRRYEVVAVQKKLIYNRYGDHDPNGLVFVPLEDVDNVLAGKCMPEPLILRANVGDWI